MTDIQKLEELAKAAVRPKRKVSRDPEKVRAHGKVRDALISGVLTRPSICEKCGVDPGKASDGRSMIQGHHHKGYDRPLDVEWICARCHRAETPFNVPKGVNAKATKLSESEVMDIRTKRISQKAFADLYGVAQSNICYIQRRETWSHLEAAMAQEQQP